MLIDLFTEKEIPSEPVITISQSLVKSYPLINKDNVDFEEQNNNDWEEILHKNGVLTPEQIFSQFQATLLKIMKGGPIDPKYCEFMYEQCAEWLKSDQFVMIE